MSIWIRIKFDIKTQKTNILPSVSTVKMDGTTQMLLDSSVILKYSIIKAKKIRTSNVIAMAYCHYNPRVSQKQIFPFHDAKVHVHFWN